METTHTQETMKLFYVIVVTFLMALLKIKFTLTVDWNLDEIHANYQNKSIVCSTS